MLLGGSVGSFGFKSCADGRFEFENGSREKVLDSDPAGHFGKLLAIIQEQRLYASPESLTTIFRGFKREEDPSPRVASHNNCRFNQAERHRFLARIAGNAVYL